MTPQTLDALHSHQTYLTLITYVKYQYREYILLETLPIFLILWYGI